MKWKLLSFILIFGIYLNAQERSEKEMLDFYGDVMANAYQSENRQYALDQFLPLFKNYIHTEQFNPTHSEITGINIVTPPDQSFKLYSWQMEKDNKFNYYAFLQTKDNKVYEFTQNNEDLGIDFAYYIHAPEDWYGAVYYKIREEKAKGGTQYIVTAFKKIDKFKKAKIVEVLTFAEDGTPVLGKEIFHKPVEGSRDDIYSKLLLTYDANAFVEFNYDEVSKRIIYDHLVTRKSRNAGHGMAKYPDGTYEGYNNKRGIYTYVDMVGK